MIKYILILGISITSPTFANTDADILGQQLSNLKSMGIDTSNFEGTFQSMQKDFADDEYNESSIKRPNAQVKSTYFTEVGRSSLEKCNTGETQLDTICQAAMLRHQAYLTALSSKQSQADIEALYQQHVEAAKHYIAVHDTISR